MQSSLGNRLNRTSTKDINKCLCQSYFVASPRRRWTNRSRGTTISERDWALNLHWRLTELLRGFPRIPGNSHSFAEKLDARCYVASPYGIYFIIETDRVVVLAVFHVKRNPRLLEER